MDKGGSKKFWKMSKWGVGILVCLFVIVQFIPVDRTNPPIRSELNWDSPRTQDLARRACLDCHSNETIWPWYSKIAPVSWLIVYDVNEGRDELNFSEIGNNSDDEPAELVDEIEETIRNGSMPPWNYVLADRNTRRLSATEKDDLIQGFRMTIMGRFPNNEGTQRTDRSGSDHSINEHDDETGNDD